MGSIEHRIGRLERCAGLDAAAAQEADREARDRIASEAIKRVSDEDLHVMAEMIERKPNYEAERWPPCGRSTRTCGTDTRGYGERSRRRWRVGINRRIHNLEERLASKPVCGRSEASRHLQAILAELVTLRQNCASGDLLKLAVSRAVEAGKAPAERAKRYLEFIRGMLERGDHRGR